MHRIYPGLVEKLSTALALVLCLGIGGSLTMGQVFEDDFSNPSLGAWDLDCAPSGHCHVENEELHMDASSAQYAVALIRDLQPQQRASGYSQ